jgi:hypothetical protein
MWFSVPFTLSTSLGIACVALDLPVTVDEANMGLVPVAAAQVHASCPAGFAPLPGLLNPLLHPPSCTNTGPKWPMIDCQASYLAPWQCRPRLEDSLVMKLSGC